MRTAGTSFSHIKKYFDNINNCETAKILPG